LPKRLSKCQHFSANSRDPDAEPIAGRIVQILADAEIALGGEDGGVAEGELDLFE
jgi:hypothetical protein